MKNKIEKIGSRTGTSSLIKRLRKKADSLLQEVIQKYYSGCLVCGRTPFCGHHYFPKSTSTPLRYDFENIIPLCAGCHLKHHTGYPEIQNKINEVKGEDWVNEITKRKYQLSVKPNLAWYKTQIEILSTMRDAHE